ncbi:hypothetical protein [uncultured Ruminococcus sp.]|jgi:hypothetical protein|uniref:hypothetical protein n=1 Tax=uncultured Ruminococcus sp. TaxID=165186 RepID=UPI00205A1B32|nr:hypothetical protein [uncultured Ruminococcus sp.]DAR08916.1 MAG TPA: hypothetical protein [Caudoviricetes sp.]
MTITLNADYDVTLNTALLGYVGETNARPVSVEGLTVDGADRYVLTIDYGDGTAYEVDITDGTWTPTADILRSAQTVSCQICAKKLSGDEYILVKKSRIFRLRIGAAIGDNAVPSPDVAMDALDRIGAIGKQAHADMQTAVTAAETATTSAEDAKKSATAAGVSADTATQAASRAETAKAAAETSATQADTAMQGAEIARQQAVTAQNAAKISAAQASTAAQQTTADKNITAGYAKTAKTCADSTTADKQAVQTLAEQVTADKATVADHAAKVAEDRTAAETAAQTAQSIADSLPEDYTTAVAKIAENTAEISAVKLTDKELQRRVNALYDMGNGVTHQFETDSDTAYQKTVPTGAKLMSVKSVGGKSVVWNQIFEAYSGTNNGVTVTTEADGTITLNGTAESSYIYFKSLSSAQNKIGKYILKLLILNNPDSVTMRYAYFNRTISTPTATKGTAAALVNQTAKDIELQKVAGLSGFTTGTVFNDVKIKIQIFDLTQMFGSGNEPSTVEEFESMFPNGYYPYNEGELMSMSVNNVVEQGKNLFDCYGFSCIAILNVNDERKLNNSYGTTISTIEPTNKIVVTQSQAPESVIAHSNNGWFCVGIKGMEQSKRYTFSFDFTTTKMLIQNPVLQILVNGRFPEDAINISELNVKKRVSFTLEYTKVDDRQYIELRLSGMSGIFENFQLDEGSTATAYTPCYTPISYTIPQAIQNLDGYGWSAGTARNYVDYENKKYYQCVQSVNLGTLDWKFNTTSGVGNHFYALADHLNFKYLGEFGSTIYNALCSKYRTVARNSHVFVDKTLAIDGVTVVSQIQVKDTAYPDVTAFKQAMQGVILYYELANPIITDISTLIPDDFLRNIEVEAGGSVTFKNSNDSYRIPVPSEEEYIVKLSEIGGSV